MDKNISSTDVERAMNDPEAEFGTPEAVLENTHLTKDQKFEILRRWEYDQSEIAVAEEEGMPGGEPALLARIYHALQILTGGLDVEHTPPTKQGGV